MTDNFPENWVRKEDIKALVNLVESTEECYCFEDPLSSFIPQDRATVGGYAIEFIESYRMKKKVSFGLWSCPKTDENKAKEIIAWWEMEKLI